MVVKSLCNGGTRKLIRDIKANGQYFQQSMYYVEDTQCIRIYGTDITERKRWEKQLAENREDLNRAQAVAQAGSWRLNVQRNELLWSDENHRIFGIPKGIPLTYETFLDTIHPDDREYVDAKWMAALRGEHYDIEHRIIVEDSVRWVREKAELEFDEQGQLLGGFGTTQDITERKRAEEELHNYNSRLALMSDSVSKLLVSETPQAAVNELCCKVMEHLNCHVFFNYLADEKEGRLHLNAYAGVPENIGKTIEWLDYGAAVCGCVAQEGCKIIAENIPTVRDPRTDLVASFGIKAYACHPLLSKGGGVIGTLSFGTRDRETFEEDDIALMRTIADHVAIAMERIRTQKSLLEAREDAEQRAAQLESFISNMADGVILFDSGGKIVLMNEAGKRIHDVPSDEPYGKWQEYEHYTLDDELIPLAETAAFKALRGELIRDMRYRTVTPWGRDVFISASASPVLDSHGRVVGATKVFRDITRQVEDEREKDKLFAREHHIADVLQDALKPKSAYEIPGLDIAARYEAALQEAEVGGDFYDVFDMGDDRIGILIGDVGGKGLPAAIRVAAARHSIRSYAYVDTRPSRVMTLANEALCRDQSDGVGFLTAFFAVVDTRFGTVTYANGGHETPLLKSADGRIVELDLEGRALGVMPDYEYSEGSLILKPGDLMVLVTDGITEARPTPSDLFGLDGMKEYLFASNGVSAEGIASGILNAAKVHAQGPLKDDAALVVFGLKRT
jgi:PAS domain S-box-containing protein